MKKAYIITYDRKGILSGFNYEKFHNELTSAEGVIDWWHYLESSYIIVVQRNVNASSISNYIQKIAPKKRFLVIRLNLNDHNGYLPKDAWEWFKDNNMIDGFDKYLPL